MLTMVSTGSPRWFSAVQCRRTMPRSGFEVDGRCSTTCTVARSVSPGRTGRSQRSSSTPGEPRLHAASGLREEAEGQRHGVEPARDQPPEDRPLRGLRVEVERLRVEGEREVEDLALGDGHAVGPELAPGHEVLEVEIVHQADGGSAPARSTISR